MKVIGQDIQQTIDKVFAKSTKKYQYEKRD